MPRAVPANGVGRGLEPAGTVELSPEGAHRAPAELPDGRSDEELVAGFLLGYRPRTRAAYLADLRDFCTWCEGVGVGLSEVRRMHVEGYARQRDPAGCAPPLPRRPCPSSRGGA
jgi:hypothetical protein